MPAIYVAGHNGMVGSALVRNLSEDPNNNIITASRDVLDLVDQRSVTQFFHTHSIEQVYLAAARVGGIHANNEFPAEFIYQNLTIQSNVIQAAHESNIQRLLFLGSSCIYPKLADQPMAESALLKGELESTNEPYAVAKIAGIKLCESYNRQYNRDYRSVMPTNLYGVNDNFHSVNSHVIPALIRRFHEAKISKSPSVCVWGSGAAMREFLYVDDMAEACIHLMNLSRELYQSETTAMTSHINVGTGVDCSIKELAECIARVVGYDGVIHWDRSKPDGSPRKLLDVSKLKKLGWRSNTSLQDGLTKTYLWFLENEVNIRR